MLQAMGWASGWLAPIIGTAWNIEDTTGLGNANHRSKLGDGVLDYRSSGRLGNEVPSKCATFLDINDCLGTNEAGLQTSILFAQLVKFISEQLTWGSFGATALRAGKLALVTELAPLGDVRGVDAFAAQKSAALRGAARRGLVVLKDTKFLGSTAGAALRGRHNLRRARVRGAGSEAVPGR